MLEIKARTMALYLESVKNDCARSDVERPLTKWQNTTLALHRVENLLYCSVCKEILENPYTYSVCYHHFCQGCIKAECGLDCPECGIPIWSKDLLPNFQLANVMVLLQHMKSLIAMDSRKDDKPGSTEKVDVDKVQTSMSEHTILSLNKDESNQDRMLVDKKLKPSVYGVTSTESEEDSKAIDKRLALSTAYLPSGQTDEFMKNKELDVPEKDQPLSFSRETRKFKNLSEFRKPRAKRRRILSSNVHSSCCSAKEATTKFPFSPVYKRTRSFQKKTLPISDLTVWQKSSMEGIGVDEGDQDSIGQTDGIKKLKAPKRINHKGETMLHLLAIKGDANFVNKLLQDGEDPNIKDNAGWTPLHEACNHGHYTVADLLLSNGALVNIPGYANCTPLHDAVLNGHLDIVKLLITKGADPSIRNKFGKCPDDLTDDFEMKHVLQLSNKVDLLPQTLKSPHASPILNGGPSKVVLLGTSLKGSQKAQLLHAAKVFNATMCDSFNSDVTHLITSVENDCCPRTLKYLYAVAASTWIVNFDWIIDSLSKNEWADETFYEVKGCTTSTEIISSEAPRKSRENFAKGAPGIFDGCHFYFYGSFMPPKASKEELTHLVTLANGSVIHREPKTEDVDRQEPVQWPYHFKGKHWISDVFIIYDPSSKNIPVVSELNTRAFAASWILDCLSHFELRL